MYFDPSAFVTRLRSVGRLFEMSQMVVESRYPGVLATLAGGVAVFALARVRRSLLPDASARSGLMVDCIGPMLWQPALSCCCCMVTTRLTC